MDKLRTIQYQSGFDKSIDSCKTQNINIVDHFREVTKMVELGSGAKREVILINKKI